MGLDMYLYRVPSNITDEGAADYVNEQYERLFAENPRVSDSVESLVAYWRKANAIHGWFVREVQDDVDECQYAEAPKEKLEELLELCERVKKTQNAELLYPVGGFFFGTTEVDEWYWDDIDTTIGHLEKVLETTDFGRQKVVYHSSW